MAIFACGHLQRERSAVPAHPRRPGRSPAGQAVLLGKAAVAWAIGCALLLGAIAMVGDPNRTGALTGWIGGLTWVLGIWSLWPVTYTLWPARPKRSDT